MSTKKSTLVVNTGQYRKCFNHQILEIPSALNTISATEIVKEFSGVKYHVSSVDGNTYKMTAFTNKLWDLIVLKLTEVVSHHSYKGYKWDDCDPWYIDLSIKTVADCLNLSTRTDALTHLYDRIGLFLTNGGCYESDIPDTVPFVVCKNCRACGTCIAYTFSIFDTYVTSSAVF